MICKERSIGLQWFSTEQQIMTLFYLANRAVSSWYIQLNKFLKISGGNCPVALSMIAKSASKTCQYYLEQWFSDFHEPWPPSKGSQHLWSRAHQQKYLVLAFARGPCSASARGPQRTALWSPRGMRAPFEKPWLRNKSCKRLGSRPKRSIKTCYTNWTLK